MKCVVCDAEKANYRCRACGCAYCSSACYKKHRMSREEATAAVAAHTGAEKDSNSTTATTEAGSHASTLDYLCETIAVARQREGEREAQRHRTEAEADVFSDISREKASAGGHRGRTGDPLAANTALLATQTSAPGSATGNVAITAAAEASYSTLQPEPQNSDEKHEQHKGETVKGGAQATAQPQQPASTRTAASNREEEVAGDMDAVYILQERHLSALMNDANIRSALRSPSLQKLIRTIDSSRSRLDALDAAQYNNADFKKFCDDVMRIIAKAEGR
ncbi:hypothetical protein ABL78_7833 [Leptomonas seymouri]|uniref:HIT-type domain-containing protein n=1 Tax=Leptomonas seymouri TaxID=5684 RepID=A0A0N1HTG1_LEPSE|nr:hypothetical protein ABL78_7833 [Leptomonas seymouri]|eukprot:KPI83145.1 hypothetical protein ABL78_7833 [Leptomonas seymouri]